MTIKLNCRTTQKISLQDALTSCTEILKPSEDCQTVVLLYTPDRCRFATFADGKLSDENGQVLAEPALRNVFEARVFNPAAELRWLHTGEGKGDAALVSEQNLSAWLQLEGENLDALEPLEQRYLLWGEGTGVTTPGGWQRLTAARIGRLDVPLHETVTSGARVQLHAREYLREVDEHGNVAVVEERLLKLEVAE